MSLPASRQELSEYCLRALGAPIIEINVTSEQIDDRIDDAIQLYQTWAENGVIRVFYKHQITADDITNKYITLPGFITGVIRVLNFNTGSPGIGSPFNIQYQLRLNDMFDLGSTTLLYYTQAMQHLDMIDLLLNGSPQFRFNRVMDRLFLDTTWGSSGKIQEGMWVIVECYQAVDPDEFVAFWNEPWFKKYVKQLIKRQWGENLKKFQGVALVGGVQINGQTMFDEADQQIALLEQELKDVWQSPALPMVG
jgi:hypothetical protein